MKYRKLLVVVCIFIASALSTGCSYSFTKTNPDGTVEQIKSDNYDEVQKQQQEEQKKTEKQIDEQQKEIEKKSDEQKKEIDAQIDEQKKDSDKSSDGKAWSRSWSW